MAHQLRRPVLLQEVHITSPLPRMETPLAILPIQRLQHGNPANPLSQLCYRQFTGTTTHQTSGT